MKYRNYRFAFALVCMTTILVSTSERAHAKDPIQSPIAVAIEGFNNGVIPVCSSIVSECKRLDPRNTSNGLSDKIKTLGKLLDMIVESDIPELREIQGKKTGASTDVAGTYIKICNHILDFRRCADEIVLELFELGYLTGDAKVLRELRRFWPTERFFVNRFLSEAVLSMERAAGRTR
jgi:hypothetical protein